MTQPGLILRQIHRHSIFSFEIQQQVERIPRQINAQKSRAERLEKEFKEAQDKLKKVKISIHEKEVTLKELNGQLVKLKRQLNESGDPKAFEALQHEIGFVNEHIAKTEDEGMNGLMELEEKTAALPVLEKTMKEAREECANGEKSSLEKKADLEVQWAQAKNDLAEAEKLLAKDFLEQYQRIFKEKGHDALAPMQGKICTACATEITPQMKLNIVNLAFVLCKSCNRILYLSEEEHRELQEND
ncbi:MAG: hypothetical protein EXR99_12345 [Gemmataceae bacterium]|nr:hypothetical protein [Gemmataceae bacterium]